MAKRLLSHSATSWQRFRARVMASCMTIRGRIGIAFLIMATITGALGAFATSGIKDAGILVDKTYDELLMSINYARAAAADFADMRAAFAHILNAAETHTRVRLDGGIRTCPAQAARR